MGKSSKILNCIIHAGKGINAFDVGNDSGIQNTLICGEDFTTLEKVRKLKKNREQLMQSIDEKVKFDPMAETWEETAKIEEYEKAIEQLQTEAVCNKNVRIEISGTVFPGTEVKICESTFKVDSKLHHGFFYYNTNDEKVLFQNH